MKIKGITDECFSDFKEPSMYIAFPKCSFKCDIEANGTFCQNSQLAKEPTLEVEKEKLIERYLKNPITKAIVLGGLEPFDSELDLLPFIDCLRRQYECYDKVVIYTGYTEQELQEGRWGNGNEENQKNYWQDLLNYGNLVIKFGRFVPNQEPHFDEVLGVMLASDNQYAKEYPFMTKVSLNPDSELVKEIREKLKENGGYCPCALVQNEDTKCMCKEFREAIKNNILGECHCGLYINVEDTSKRGE